jgi:hypothetical protein
LKLRVGSSSWGSCARALRAAAPLCLLALAAPAAAAPPAGPRAAKIIFRKHFPGGSFDAPPVNGTVNAPGLGHKAARVFNTDGSLLASSTSSPNWPKWLTSFEIGVSGLANSGALNPDCARFADAGEQTSADCDFDADGSYDVDCGAQENYYRVSEWDCTKPGSPALDGKGGPDDGVYLRATFNRDPAYLAYTENLSVVLEYSASALNEVSADPTKCFVNGVFTPSQPGCSDMVWQSYLKHDAYQLASPFLMLVPPAVGYRSASANRGGSGHATRQFYLPLAGDRNITVFQLSRIKALPNSGSTTELFYRVCNETGNTTSAANSAHCVGMVFHSLTFIRM